jgi:hypothetical protein
MNNFYQVTHNSLVGNAIKMQMGYIPLFPTPKCRCTQYKRNSADALPSPTNSNPLLSQPTPRRLLSPRKHDSVALQPAREIVPSTGYQFILALQVLQVLLYLFREFV